MKDGDLYLSYLDNQKDVIAKAGTNKLPNDYQDITTEINLRDEISQTAESIGRFCEKLASGDIIVDAPLLKALKLDADYLKKEILKGKKSTMGSGYIPKSFKDSLNDEYEFALNTYGGGGSTLSSLLNRYPMELIQLSATHFQFDEDQVNAYVKEKSTFTFDIKEQEYIDLINKTSLAAAELLKYQVAHKCLSSQQNVAGDFIRATAVFSPDYFMRNNPMHIAR